MARIYKRNWKPEELKDILLRFESLSTDRMMPLEYARAVSRWSGASETLVLQVALKLIEEGKLHLENGFIPVRHKSLQQVRTLAESNSKDFQGWSLFRRLLDYYIECVKSESNCAFTLWSDGFEKSFSFLKREGDWYPHQNHKWSMFLAESSSEVFDDLLLDGKKLTLGYPVYAQTVTKKSGEEVVNIKPVFCWRIKCQPAGGAIKGYTIELEEPNELPEINLDWLRNALKKPEQKRSFLEKCGLFDDGQISSRDDEGGVTASTWITRWSVRDFSRIISQLFHYKVVESVVPEKLCTNRFQIGIRPGYYNRAILFSSTQATYTKRLLAELEFIKSVDDSVLEQTALKYFFWQGKLDKTPEPTMSQALDVLNFNVHQRGSVAAMLNSPITVMKGPPGTGKSQVVAGVAINERIRRESVLVSAANHKAIDALVERIAKINSLGEGPFIVRCNSKNSNEQDFGFSDAIDLLLKLETKDVSQERQQYNLAKIEFETLQKQRELKESNANRINGLAYELKKVLAEKTLIEEQHDWVVKIPKIPKKVELVRIQTFFEQIREESGKLFWPSISKIRQALHSRFWVNNLSTITPVPKLSWFGSLTIEEIDTLEQKTDICAKYESATEKCDEIITKLKAETKTATEWCEELATVSEQIAKKIPELVRLDSALRVEDALGGRNNGIHRTELSNAKVVIRDVFSGMDVNRNQFCTKAFKASIENLLVAYPTWAVTSLSVGRLIPLVAGLFNLVLIDEATQANIAMAIPLLFRAKRAAIIGDPQQLQFISMLRPDTDYILRTQAKINEDKYRHYSYCEQSLYDFAAGVNGAFVTGLNETFRSCPEIAAYSGATFYRDNLLVATDISRLKLPQGHRLGIEWVDVNASIEPATGTGCWCLEEAETVATQVKSILVNAEFQGTIGVVTPFAYQAQRIDDLVRERSGIPQAVLDRSQFLSRTAHSFQGDERDVIIFSLCSGRSMPQGCLNFVTKEANIFNVAASRARSLLLIVGNKSWAQQCNISHISALTRDWRTYYEPKVTQWAPYESKYEQILGERLKQEGLDIIPQFRVSTRRLDFALFKGSAKLDIEVDSDTYHRGEDGYRKIEDTWRDEQLIRLGWKPLRIWTYEIDHNLDKCVQDIKTQWQDLLAQAGN